MARIRSVKPGFYRHELLNDLENNHPELRVMLTFSGLWTLCDSQGVFEWRPRQMKLDLLPFVNYDLGKTLSLLEENGFILRFSVDGKEYGFVIEFRTHQKITGKEATEGKRFPSPPKEATEKQLRSNREVKGKPQGNHRETTGKPQGVQEKEEEKEEEKERSVGSAHAHEEEISLNAPEEKMEEGSAPPEITPEEEPPPPPPEFGPGHILSFESLSEQLQSEIWQEGVCMANHFDLIQFRDFIDTWLANKKLTGDYMYPVVKMRGFVISDFKKELSQSTKLPTTKRTRDAALTQFVEG